MRRAYGAIAPRPPLRASGLRAQDRSGRFQSGVDLISVTATVVDRDGHLVTGLPIEAFEIFEEGERQTITQFTNERVPVSLAVLLDVSDSMFGQRLVDARSAVERFLFELLDKNDEFSVVAFNHEPRALTRWTQTPDVVRTAMAALKPFGSTALYDAVLTALPMMDTRTKQRASVLIISDGADTASDAALREVRSALIRSDAFVYAIAVDPPAKRAINETVNVSALERDYGRKRRQHRARAPDRRSRGGDGAHRRRAQQPVRARLLLPAAARRQLSQHPRARHQSRISRAGAARIHRDAANETARLAGSR